MTEPRAGEDRSPGGRRGRPARPAPASRRGGRAPLHDRGGGRRGDPRRWPCAARRRSASPPRTGYALAAAQRGEDLDAAYAALAAARARRPSTCAGRSRRCARDPTRPSARTRHSTPTRSSAAGAMARTRRRALRARHARAHALQRRRPRDRRLRHGARRAARGVGARPARARLGRRDAAAASRARGSPPGSSRRSASRTR